MASLKCANCGGQMKLIGNTNEAVCEFCGNKEIISAADLKTLSKFRDMFQSFIYEIDSTKSKLKANRVISEQPEEEEEELAPTFLEEFYKTDGNKIQINYLYKNIIDGITMYITRKNVLYLFPQGKEDEKEQYIRYVKAIEYPNNQMKKLLNAYIPEVVMILDIRGGETLVAIDKLKYTYPLNIVEKLDVKHMSWIVSRLENLMCLLEFNAISLNDITKENIFIDPKHHQVLLYGGWWKAITGVRNDLQRVRSLASSLVSITSPIPKTIQEFLDSEPKSCAADDFEYWDMCLDKAYEKREFVKLEIKEKDIF